MSFSPRAFGFALLTFLPCTASAVSKETPIVSVSTPTLQVSSGIKASTFTWRTLPNTAFKEGEKLAFVLKWGVIVAGRASLAVHDNEVIQGRPAYHIVTEAKTSGIADTFYKTRDKNETWLDVQSLATVRYEKHIREGKFKVEAVVDLDQPNQRYRSYLERLDKGTTTYTEGPVPPYIMDVLGSLYYIRTLSFNVGDSFVIDVFDGKKIWPLVVNIAKREKIKVAAGKFDCYRVEPVLREPGIFINKGKKLEVWMTADERHMPVLMRSEVAIGHVAAELTSYRVSIDSRTATP